MPTLSPGPTLEPWKTAASATEGTVLFQDDFSNIRSGWNNVETLYYITKFENNRYRIYVKDIDTFVSANPRMVFSDIVINVLTEKLSGPNNGSYGVICRYTPNNFYLFEIDGDGYYVISKLKDNNWIILLDWQAAPDVINPGNAANQFRVSCVGNTLTMYVNDQKLAEIFDSDFSSGDVGLSASSYDKAGVEVIFDNFQVLDPSTEFLSNAPHTSEFPHATPTISITPTFPDGILFQDDFSDPSSGLDRIEYSDGLVDYTDDGYRILVNRELGKEIITIGLDIADASIEVDTILKDGPDDARFGLVCRYDDYDNYYKFQIYSDGFFNITKLMNGEQTFPVFDFSNAINVGNAENHIRVDCVGDTLTFYVNEVMLVRLKDDGLYSGDVGLTAGTHYEPGTDVIFKDMVVSDPHYNSR